MKILHLLLPLTMLFSLNQFGKETHSSQINRITCYDSDFKIIHSNNELESLKLAYNDLLILKSIYFIDKSRKLNLYNWQEFNKIDDWFTFESDFNHLLKETPDLLNLLFKKVSEENNSKELIRRIKNWCETYNLITMPIHLNLNISFEKAIYENSITKSEVSKFLTHSGQTWESLSESQIYQLYYDVCNNLAFKTDIVLLQFYQEFMENIISQNK